MAEIGLWHAMRGSQPTRLLEESIPLEKDLENWIFEDPTLISPSLQRVRRQVPLGNKFMDLLAIEEPGLGLKHMNNGVYSTTQKRFAPSPFHRCKDPEY